VRIEVFFDRSEFGQKSYQKRPLRGQKHSFSTSCSAEISPPIFIFLEKVLTRTVLGDIIQLYQAK